MYVCLFQTKMYGLIVIGLSYFNKKFQVTNWFPKSCFSFSRNFLKKPAIAVIVIYVTYRALKYRHQKSIIKKKIFTKLKDVNKNKDKLEQNLASCDFNFTNKSNQIIELEIPALLEQLQNGTLTCLEVLRAYQIKALEVTSQYNCVTEFILEAEDWAKELDSAANQAEKGPLHGLPFSVKENVSVTGYDTTIGISKFLHQPATEDAALVIALKKLGAIPFCRTNVPQTNLSFGCSNPIWGLTKNPWDPNRTPGGSTGGEACLIAARGSPLGIGSDIGGSMRLPAAFCGVYSIKPTVSRMSLRGYKKVTVGNVGIEAVPGIMARDSITLIKVTELLLRDGHLRIHGDPNVLPIPWNELMFTEKKKLRIGYYEDDGFFPTTPGIRRVVQTVKSTLEALGHDLIPFTPPRVDYVMHSFMSLMTADQSRYLIGAIGNDDVDPLLQPTMRSLRLPYILKRLFQPFVSLLAPRLVPIYTGIGGHRLRETHQLWLEIMKKNEYKEEFLNQWRKLDLDLCIAPCFASPAPLAKDVGKLVPAISYTVLYNFLDFPVGIVPVDKENNEDQLKLNTDYSYADLVCKMVKTNCEGALGMPLVVQMIGLPYQEEMVLRGVEILDEALKRQNGVVQSVP